MHPYWFLVCIVATTYHVTGTSGQTRRYPTTAQVETAHAEIVKLINDNRVVTRRTQSFPFRAGFVRLAFHSCVGGEGCDGCVDLSIEDNNGLQMYMDALETIYTDSVMATMSKADFYILAGYVALEEASKHQPPEQRVTREGNFKAGRITCTSTPPRPNPPFPKGTDEIGDTDNFFQAHFPDFNILDIVAILGVHTLGQAQSNNLGFDGKWVNGFRVVNGVRVAKSDLLDNEFYRKVNGNKWNQVEMNSDSGTKKQWVRENRQKNIALNIDMSMQFDLKTDGPIQSDGTVSCDIKFRGRRCQADNCCNRNPSIARNIFEAFRKSNTEWIKAFTRAFNSMTSTKLPLDALRFPTP